MKYISLLALLLFAGCAWLSNPAVVADLEKTAQDVVQDGAQVVKDSVPQKPAPAK